eukprot:6194785-Pleurochrysis_carterae.AAC.3
MPCKVFRMLLPTRAKLNMKLKAETTTLHDSNSAQWQWARCNKYFRTPRKSEKSEASRHKAEAL